jgi:hypothetical protein
MEYKLTTVKELLKGAVDTHIHSGPDILVRSVDDIEAAQQAKKAGMKAIVLKCHDSLTADRALIATKVTGFPVYGGLVLNATVGGFNPFAVQRAIDFGAKIIWGPTTTGANLLAKSKTVIDAFTNNTPSWVKGSTPLNKNKELTPEALKILEIIKEADMILATGDLSVEESKILVKKAEAIGIRRIMVTHPQVDWMRFSLKDLEYLTSLGAKAEHCVSACNKLVQHPIPVSEIAHEIKVIGAENSTLATDGGWCELPPPVQLMKDFIAKLIESGISEEEIRIMTNKNPSQLLKI